MDSKKQKKKEQMHVNLRQISSGSLSYPRRHIVSRKCHAKWSKHCGGIKGMEQVCKQANHRHHSYHESASHRNLSEKMNSWQFITWRSGSVKKVASLHARAHQHRFANLLLQLFPSCLALCFFPLLKRTPQASAEIAHGAQLKAQPPPRQGEHATPMERGLRAKRFRAKHGGTYQSTAPFGVATGIRALERAATSEGRPVEHNPWLRHSQRVTYDMIGLRTGGLLWRFFRLWRVVPEPTWAPEWMKPAVDISACFAIFC